MARIRTIKPEFPHSESMGFVSRDARLAFILMWTIADDSGRLRGNSRMLASLLFPYDEDAGKKMDHWVDELQKQNCIVRYKADNSEYIQIQKWLIHQRIDKPSPSKIPEFQEDSANTPRLFQEASDSPPVRKGRERKGKEEEGSISGIGSGKGKDPALNLPSWLPDEAWNDYCRHRGKDFTSRAKNLAINQLERFWNDGHDVEVILNNSVMNGWKGLFEPKPQSNFQSYPSKKKPNNADILDIAINAGREYSAAFSTPPQGNHYGKNPTDQNPTAASKPILTDEERAAARAESERLDQEFIDGLNAAYEAESRGA